MHPEVDAFYSAMFFLLGVYGVLTHTTSQRPATRCSGKLVAPPYAAWRSDDLIVRQAKEV